MTDDNFLQSVARFFSAAAPGRPAPENIVYVLPNKRSAMFLKKYVRETVNGVAFMPRFMTMRSFVSLFAPFPEAQPRELLFILYEAYRRAMHDHGRAEGVREFDSFIFWGDMMLSDFDDIDRSLVNADELFKNLRDVKEIQADYLDEDQKEIIRRVWGESRLTADVEGFWLHLHNDSDDSMGARFVYLWEILADVYRHYHALLREKRLSSAGAQYRDALAAIKALAPYDLPADTHYVFVGFNDLSTAETLIFAKLKELGAASFFWDSAPLTLAPSADELAKAKPLLRLRELMRSFPMPEGYVCPEPAGVPSITVTAVPSNIGQAKAVNKVLSKWVADGDIDSADPLNTAVVLPDQGLLLPTLLSIPSEIEKINISMGLPYRTTTFASLLHSIVSMQLRAREIRGVTHFFYEDVNAVLAHPHIQVIAREEADAVAARVAADKLYNIAAADIVGTAPSLAAVFAPVRDLHNVADVAAYLLGLFSWLEERLGAVETSAHTFEIQAIKYFRAEVEALAMLVGNYGVTMSDRTFLLLFERIFNARGLTVSGTPLQGLQMLGVLETRALDFDNVVILSMNERVFPRKQYTRTMIPNTLRTGFGLPDFESLEWTYAYCFYRLMARARRVALFYDSRAEGQGNGEVSRYVSQMRYLMPALKVTVNAMGYSSQPDANRPIEIPKTADVMADINRFREGGNLRLSASALKTYKKCPLCFYLEYARRMRGNDELVDYISAADFGTVVHNVVQSLYSSYKNSLITGGIIDRWLAEGNREVDEAARLQIVAQRYPKGTDPDTVELSAESMLACNLVASIARANLAAEKELYCKDGKSFTFIENEYKVNGVWPVDDDLRVNFYMSIDRVDRIDGGLLRFIDFKTGGDDNFAKEMAALFSDNHAKDGVFQLFVYCEAYGAMVDSGVQVQPVLHPMRSLSAGEALGPIRIGGKPVGSYADVRAGFRPLLQNFIKEIFDPEVPLRQCDNSDNCRFCPFQTLCGRIPERQ